MYIKFILVMIEVAYVFSGRLFRFVTVRHFVQRQAVLITYVNMLIALL
jgi:hypothetical protein